MTLSIWEWWCNAVGGGGDLDRVRKTKVVAAGGRAVRLLSDRPIGDDQADRLGHGAIADAFADLIDDPKTQTPLTMAVTARWGAGKTSFVQLVRQRLGVVHSWRDPHLVCEFNAWLHEDAPNPAAALASAVARTVNSRRRWWQRLAMPVSVRMLSAQARWARVVTRAVGSAAVAIVLVSLPVTREAVVSLAGRGGPVRPVAEAVLRSPLLAAAGLAVLLWLVATKVFAAGTALSRFFANPRDEAAAGAMHEVRDELGTLVNQALRGRNRLVIIVDDLDRCSGERALRICQAAAKLLDHDGVVTVLVGDVDHLAAAAAREAGGTEPDDILAGKRYLEKLIQVELFLPAVHRADIQGLVDGIDSEIRAPGEVTRKRSFPRPLVEWARGLSLRRVGESTATAAAVFAVALSFQLLLYPLPGLTRVVAPLVVVVVGLGALMGRVSWGMAIITALGMAVVVGSVELIGLLGASEQEVTIVVLAALVAAPMLVSGFRSVPGERARRQSSAITLEIQSASQEGATAAEIEIRLVSRFGTAETMRRRIDRFIAEESDAAREANTAILRFLPVNPRTAKRIVNKLRLLLVIAFGRGLLGTGSPVTIDHLVKWVALLERWPAFAHGAASTPGLLVEAESAAYAELNSVLARHLDSEVEIRELRSFLTEGSRLAPVLDELVHLTAVRSITD